MNKVIGVLEQAQSVVKKHWPRNRWWKVLSFIGFTIIVVLIAIGGLFYLLGQIVKGLGRPNNPHLYTTRMRRRI